MNEFKTTQELNSYILDRVNHETDIIMESEWFNKLIEPKLQTAVSPVLVFLPEEYSEAFVCNVISVQRLLL